LRRKDPLAGFIRPGSAATPDPVPAPLAFHALEVSAIQWRVIRMMEAPVLQVTLIGVVSRQPPQQYPPFV
jgi:hypothetical protein